MNEYSAIIALASNLITYLVTSKYQRRKSQIENKKEAFNVLSDMNDKLALKLEKTSNNLISTQQQLISQHEQICEMKKQMVDLQTKYEESLNRIKELQDIINELRKK